MSHLQTVREMDDGIEMEEKKRNEHKLDEKTKEKEMRNEKQEDVKTTHSSSGEGVDKFATLISRLYGPDYIAARKLLNRRLKQKGMGAKPALSLYDRIMMYRKVKDGENEDSETKDSETKDSEEDTRKIGRAKSNNSLDSVDISQYTNSNNEPRTPTPKPTVNTQHTRRSGSARSLIRRKQDQVQTDQRSLSASEESLKDEILYIDPAVTSRSTSLQPGYDVIPIIVSTNTKHSDYVYLYRSFSDPDIFGSGSDVRAESRDTWVSSNTRRVRKKRTEMNANEFSLAEKMILQREVMAALRSSNHEHDTLRMEEGDVKATPRDVYVDFKDTEQVVEERNTSTHQTRERSRDTVVKEERTYFPPVRSATPQRPSSKSPVVNDEKTSLPPIAKEERAIKREIIRQGGMVHDTRVGDTVVMGSSVTTERIVSERATKSETTGRIASERATKDVERINRRSEVSTSSHKNTHVETKNDNKRSSSNTVLKDADHKQRRTSSGNVEETTRINNTEERIEHARESNTHVKQEKAVREEQSKHVRSEAREKEVRKEQSSKNEQKKEKERNDYNKPVIANEDVRAVITSPRTPREDSVVSGDSPSQEETADPYEEAEAAAADLSESSPIPSPIASTAFPTAKKKPTSRNKSEPMDNTSVKSDDLAALDKLADYNLDSLMGQDVGEAPQVNSKLMDKVFSPEFQDKLDNFLAER